MKHTAPAVALLAAVVACLLTLALRPDAAPAQQKAAAERWEHGTLAYDKTGKRWTWSVGGPSSLG